MQIKDSGTREQFETGAVRDLQGGKGRFDLMPYHALERVAQHFEAGAKKYEDRNWEKGIPTHCFANSALRHLLKHIDGQRDEDHAAAAAWNVICLMQTERWIAEGVLPASLATLPEGDWEESAVVTIATQGSAASDRPAQSCDASDPHSDCHDERTGICCKATPNCSSPMPHDSTRPPLPCCISDTKPAYSPT